MVDPGTGLTILGGAIGSAKLLEKMLGPTADYIGEGVKTWTEKRVENVKRIFQIGVDRLGEKIEQPGSIPPKILRGIVNEGSFCEDQLTAEYFGGILAASRSGINRDDRGVTFITLLSRLSTYQIRAHYVFYQIVKTVLNGKPLHLTLAEERNKAQVYIPFQVFDEGLAITEDEVTKYQALLDHVIFGLGKEELIVPGEFAYGSIETMRKFFPAAPGSGVVFKPSVLGVELFLWGHGRSDLDINEFLNIENSFDVSQEVSIPSGSTGTKAQ